MSAWKIIGIVGAGLVVAVGGFLAWRYFRRQPERGRPERVPSREDVAPEPAPDLNPRHRVLGRDELAADMVAEIDSRFPNGWPPDDATFDRLEPDHLILFAVESEQVGNFDQRRREILVARVLEVGSSAVRARVIDPVEFAEHHGSHAGHGVRVGMLVEIPREQVLVAAELSEAPRNGYGSRGKPAATLTPTNRTPTVHRVKPGTPYDLVLPYRTPDLHWSGGEGAEVVHIGARGPLEQVMFGESTIRGRYTLTVLDHDEQADKVFVASWSFEVDD